MASNDIFFLPAYQILSSEYMSEDVTGYYCHFDMDIFINALSQHIYTYHKLSEYAKLLSVSPNYLNKCVKTTTGKSAHDLFNDVVLLETKALLKQSPLSISEIAYKIGKNDPSDFSRFFKAQTGKTPKAYRESD